MIGVVPPQHLLTCPEPMSHRSPTWPVVGAKEDPAEFHKYFVKVSRLYRKA